ncbi:MAG: AraC family transcriptional regulator [Leptospira sp.]|nr:AraC family transcriptional regulator [Leptospira sp.]
MQNYNPIQDGIKKTTIGVTYNETKPPDDLSELVHCYWELKSEKHLSEDFCLHVLPDACVNILLNVCDVNIAAVTARETTYVELNLGKNFHYIGIQFLPGIWKGKRDEIAFGFVDSPYQGDLPLVETAKQLLALGFQRGQEVLTDLVQKLRERKLVETNLVTGRILADLDVIDTVEDMAASANLSPRQLQRTLKKTTGFSPHDFLKVLRLQQSFRVHYLESYVDQSHFIHSFRRITGYTPAEYFKSFHV